MSLDSDERSMTPQDSIEVNLDLILPYVAETTIVKTILQGSSTTLNEGMTDPGLRFIRHLLSTSRPARHGFLPNFKDRETVHHLAREFIRRCGGATNALKSLVAIAHPGEA